MHMKNEKKEVRIRMKQKTLAIVLMAIIIGVAICAAVVYIILVPEFGMSLAKAGSGEFRYMYAPWYWFIMGTALPVAAALVLSFLIAVNIARDRSFCMENAKLLAVISILALVDGAYFFIGNVIFIFLSMNHPGVFVLSMLVCFACVAVSVAAAALSHYARKAAELKEQADLTI